MSGSTRARNSAATRACVCTPRVQPRWTYLLNDDEIDRATYDVYAWNARPREIFVALDWSAFELRLGEQIVNLGQGEVLSALDVVNPRDLREPLSNEAEDMRLPVLMSRASVTFDRVRIEAIVVHEPYFGMLAPPLGEFNPMRKLILEDPTSGPALEDRTLRNAHVPPHKLIASHATQFHARLTWSGPSVDLALVASDLLDSVGVPILPPAAAFDSDTIDFPIAHPRYALFGYSGAYTLGPCLLRWELVYEHRRPVTLQRTDTDFTLWTRGRLSALRGMFGVTYAPTPRTSAGLRWCSDLSVGPDSSGHCAPLPARSYADRAAREPESAAGTPHVLRRLALDRTLAVQRLGRGSRRATRSRTTSRSHSVSPGTSRLSTSECFTASARANACSSTCAGTSRAEPAVHSYSSVSLMTSAPLRAPEGTRPAPKAAV